VSILDCARDSIVATVQTGYHPRALCCGDDGKVYVANHGGGVAVIDGSGDSVRTVVPIDQYLWTLCYNRTDEKVYVSRTYGSVVSVIDANTDSVVDTMSVSVSRFAEFCWNQRHDKLYVCGRGDHDSVSVFDCTSDTVLKRLGVSSGLYRIYCDSTCDKVYGADTRVNCLRIIQAATDTFYRSLDVGNVTALLDNGKQGPANRLYCTNTNAGEVAVVAGYKTDSILCRIPVGDRPGAFAWNPMHSWVYVSSSGRITVIRDTLGVGVEESRPQASSHKLQATVVRGVLDLGVGSGQNTGYWAELLDAAGRIVMSLKSGANVVSRLAPGVYFVREAQAQAQVRAQAVQKVIITK